MKKLLMLSVLLLVFLLPAMADTDEIPVESGLYELDAKGWWSSLWDGARFTYDLYFRSVLTNRDGLNIGGGISLGAKTDVFRFDTYVQGDYFLEPLGGNGGAAAMEFDLEGGITLGWNFWKFWHFDTYLACDLGYFAQFVRTHYQPDDFTLGFNGIVIRPKLYTELNFAKYWGISIAVFYQIPVYPAYSDYRGFGIMLSIL